MKQEPYHNSTSHPRADGLAVADDRHVSYRVGGKGLVGPIVVDGAGEQHPGLHHVAGVGNVAQEFVVSNGPQADRFGCANVFHDVDQRVRTYLTEAERDGGLRPEQQLPYTLGRQVDRPSINGASTFFSAHRS